MENKKYFFKIIVPNYNNYIYIKKCLDSILNQTFTDWHCIVVDDLSTDNSDKIAETYAKSYPSKFTFLRMKEKGYAGGARNMALDLQIKSEYTYFLDSDDWLYNNDSLKNIFESSKDSPDVIECAYIELKNNIMTTTKQFTNTKDILFNGVQPFKHCINSKYDNIRFKSKRAKNNDMIWGIRIFDKIDDNKISFTKNIITVYNKDSLTSCQNSPSVKNNIECVDAQIKMISDLKNETFDKGFCNEFKEKTIKNYEQYYKDYSKNISIDDILKNSFVISIDENKVNIFYKIFSKQFKNLPQPQRVYGSKDSFLTGPQNCTKSHINVVKKAKSLDLPFVLIFEDDAYPCIDVMNKFQLYLKYIPEDAKLLILGWSNHVQSKKYKQSFGKHINKITTIISGSHSYILFKNGYDEYINYFSKNPTATADCYVFYELQPSYILNSPLFIQYSNIKSMHNHIGYIFYGDHKNPPENFPYIDYYEL